MERFIFFFWQDECRKHDKTIWRHDPDIMTSLSYLISEHVMTIFYSFCLLTSNFWSNYSGKQWKMNQNMCSDAPIANHHIDYERVYWINFKFFIKHIALFHVAHCSIWSVIQISCISLVTLIADVLKILVLFFIPRYLLSSSWQCCSPQGNASASFYISVTVGKKKVQIFTLCATFSLYIYNIWPSNDKFVQIYVNKF